LREEKELFIKNQITEPGGDMEDTLSDAINDDHADAIETRALPKPGTERIRGLIQSNPLYRPVLYRILEACQNQRVRLPDLEGYIGGLVEFKSSSQPQYSLIQWLVDAGALDEYEVDAEGEIVSDEQKQGLEEDELDDLIQTFAYQISADGRTVLTDINPVSRLEKLLAEVPERYDTYIEVLQFLRERHSYAEIDALLRGREILMSGREPDDRPMQPSVFVDKLAANGGLVWDKGWTTTKEGKELLDKISGQKA
jgi:hypothetical protein